MCEAYIDDVLALFYFAVAHESQMMCELMQHDVSLRSGAQVYRLILGNICAVASVELKVIVVMYCADTWRRSTKVFGQSLY